MGQNSSTSCHKTYIFASLLLSSLLPSSWPRRQTLYLTKKWIPSIPGFSGMLLHPSLPSYWLYPMSIWARHCLKSPSPPPDSTLSHFCHRQVSLKYMKYLLFITFHSVFRPLYLAFQPLHIESMLEKSAHYFPFPDCMCNFCLSSRLIFLQFDTTGHSKYSLCLTSGTWFSIYPPSHLAIPSFPCLGPLWFLFQSLWLISSSLVVGS